MRNIIDKKSTHRTAIARAEILVSKKETIEAIERDLVPKGDVFEMSRAAALLASKNTSNVIPDCHTLPIEFAEIVFKIKELEIEVQSEIQTVYKTGVEIEALHACMIAALTIYDMLKPIDKRIIIKQIELVKKTGGKSDINRVG